MNRTVVVVESFERDIHMTMREVGEVRFGNPAMKNNDEAALIDLIKDADAVCITSRGAFTKKVLQSAPKLRIIAKCGAPPSNVDIAAATELGIPVTWTPGSNAISVAEHALTLILAALKLLPQTMKDLQNGGWHTSDKKASELTGRTVGIVGLGQAGFQLAKMLKPFNVEILCYDPYIDVEKAREVGAKPVERNELFAKSEIISLNCQSSPETYHMINEEALSLMRPGVYIVNTGRGALIDEVALNAAVDSGRVACAALDVFEEEPPKKDNPLLNKEKIIVTPHMAGWAGEALVREAKGAADEIIRVLNGLAPINVANPDYIRFLK
ncbi:hydroxyacid dehydrogenase [Synergistaceae bacterium OttesenSCG-928-I11]|nr:hydroxyacid dehydrogenase [Synergistaceae bacterium OttesenSCG-928-I11]